MLKLPIKITRNTQTKYEHAHLSYCSKFCIHKIHVWAVKPSVGEKPCRMELVTQYCSLHLDTAICHSSSWSQVSTQRAAGWVWWIRCRLHCRVQAAIAHTKQWAKIGERKRQSTNLWITAPFAWSPKRTPLQSTAVGPSDPVSATGRMLPEAHTCPGIGQLSHSVLHSSTLHSKVRSITSGNLNACAHKSHSLSSPATLFQY